MKSSILCAFTFLMVLCVALAACTSETETTIQPDEATESEASEADVNANEQEGEAAEEEPTGDELEEVSDKEEAASDAWTIRPDGIGPFAMGASGYEAIEQIPGARLFEGEESVSLQVDGYPGLDFYLYDTIIVGASVGEGSTLQTPEGIGIGSELSEMLAAYGEGVRQVEDYVGGGEALYIRSELTCVSGPLCEMQFTERDGRIEQISVNYLF